MAMVMVMVTVMVVVMMILTNERSVRTKELSLLVLAFLDADAGDDARDVDVDVDVDVDGGGGGGGDCDDGVREYDDGDENENVLCLSVKHDEPSSSQTLSGGHVCTTCKSHAKVRNPGLGGDTLRLPQPSAVRCGVLKQWSARVPPLVWRAIAVREDGARALDQHHSVVFVSARAL